jgi:hypothetical protein
MVCIARANRVAIQKVLPTRNLWCGQSQDAGAEPAVCPKNKKTKGGLIVYHLTTTGRADTATEIFNTIKTKSQRKEPVAMNNVKHLTVKAPQEPCRYTRRLGSTTYHVAVHFNPDTKDTAGEKIARLIRHDAAMGKAANQ